MQVDYRECCGMIFPEAVLVTTEDVRVHQILTIVENSFKEF